MRSQAGAHSAEVRKCNSAGGCSAELEIPFTIADPGPRIRVRELESEISLGPPEEFQMEAFNLVPESTYRIRARGPGDGNFDLSGSCSGSEQYESNAFTSTGTSHTETGLLGTCRETVGTLTVELLQEGESTPLDQYQKEITVRRPRIAITGLDQELENGSSIDLNVSVSGLVSTKPHTMEVSSDSNSVGAGTTGEGTSRSCLSNPPVEEIPLGTTAFTMPLTLHACGEGTATIAWPQSLNTTPRETHYVTSRSGQSDGRAASTPHRHGVDRQTGD